VVGGGGLNCGFDYFRRRGSSNDLSLLLGEVRQSIDGDLRGIGLGDLFARGLLLVCHLRYLLGDFLLLFWSDEINLASPGQLDGADPRVEQTNTRIAPVGKSAVRSVSEGRLFDFVVFVISVAVEVEGVDFSTDSVPHDLATTKPAGNRRMSRTPSRKSRFQRAGPGRSP
jgi:hypothetical protein